MSLLFRDGFAKDLIIYLVAAILIGVLLSVGTANALDGYFDHAVNGLVGDYGEFDIIVHIQEDAAHAADEALRNLVHEQWPGARLKKGLTVAGKANFFLSLPDELKTQSVFERLPNLLKSVAGYDGYTNILEPAVRVQNVHPAVRADLIAKAQSMAGVRFVMTEGSTITIAVNNTRTADTVGRQVQSFLDSQQLIEVRFPVGFEVDSPEAAGDTIAMALQDRYDFHDVKYLASTGDNGDMDSFLKALQEMKGFLLGYATKVVLPLDSNSGWSPGARFAIVAGAGSVPAAGDKIGSDGIVVEVTRVGPDQVEGIVVQGETAGVFTQRSLDESAYGLTGDRLGRRLGTAQISNDRYALTSAIDESVRLLGQLDALAGNTDQTVADAQKTLDTFERALVQLGELQTQIGELNTQLLGDGKVDPGQVLLSVFLNGLVKSMTADDKPGLDSLGSLDVKAMKANLEEINQRIGTIEKVDVNKIIAQVEHIKETLPQLSDAEIADSIHLIDRYIEGQVIPGDRIQLLASAGPNPARAEGLIRTLTGNQYATVFSTSVGVIPPDARAALYQVLGQVRQTIAGLVALGFVLLLLILDGSTILSAIRTVAAGKTAKVKGWRRFWKPAWAAGWVLGALLLGAIYIGSGAGIPLIGPFQAAMVGAILGSLIGLLAHRISPADTDEIMAGLALGLSYADTMREVVIPNGRPGLLQWLNHPKQAFR